LNGKNVDLNRSKKYPNPFLARIPSKNLNMIKKNLKDEKFVEKQ
jgi:hypothetical protein